MHFVFRVVGNDHTDEERQTNQGADEDKDVNEDRVFLEGEENFVFMGARRPTTHQAHPIHDDITDL